MRRTAWIALAVAAPWMSACRSERGLHANPESIPSQALSVPAPPWTARIDEARALARREITTQNLPGLSVAVGSPDAVVWAEGFGWSELKGPTPMTPQTRFHIGSASTMFTLAGLQKLEDLKLDEPIRTYVPKAASTVNQTVRQAMTATVMEDEELFRQRCEHAVDALEHLPKQENHGWILIGAAIESVTGQPLRSFLKQRIFDPLQMRDTGAESAAEENPERIGEPEEDPPPFTFVRDVFHLDGKPPAGRPASVYERPGFRQRVVQPRNLSCYAGALSFLSTPADLVRFASQLPAVQPQDGELHGAKTVSLRPVRNRNWTVVVMANAAYANTPAIADKIAEIFAK